MERKLSEDATARVGSQYSEENGRREAEAVFSRGRSVIHINLHRKTIKNSSLSFVSIALEREKDLSKDFRKVREDLEAGIRRQYGALKEMFGQMIAKESVRD